MNHAKNRSLTTAAVVGLLCVLAALLGAGATHASTAGRAVKTVRSPPEPGLTLGESGGTQLTSGSPTALTFWAAKARSANAQVVRISASWASIAPATRPADFDESSDTSPGYDWTMLDQQVRQLSSDGFRILLDVSVAPTWAEGAGAPPSALPGTWKPDAADFGAFATALATRYDGHTPDPLHHGKTLPRVTDWQAWNEPNLSYYLTPQWVKTAAGQTPVGPSVYRNLENAFYTSVHAVDPTNYVVAAGTAPYGDPPGGQRMEPLTFDRYLLCLNTEDQATKPCAGPTYMDAIDDHPYAPNLCCVGPTVHAASPDDTSIPDVYKVVDVLKAGKRAKTVLPSGHKGVWVSEISWNTDPPNPHPSEASPINTVGRWADESLYLLWSQGVDTVMWYGLGDDPRDTQGYGLTFTGGLYYLNGGNKPSAFGFRFPFVTHRVYANEIDAWGRSPVTGTVKIQEQSRTRWITILQVRVRADQVFQVPISQTGKATYRAVVGSMRSLPWSQAG